MSALSNCASKALSGLPRDCSTSMGGIKTVYIAPYEVVESVTLGAESGDTKGKIETISLISGATDEQKFHQYNFRKGTGSMASTLTIDQPNGVNYVNTLLNLSFLKMETQKRIEMEALSVNELAVIVRDSNNKLWYLGFDEAVTASAGAGETGQARTDGNKYSITLSDDANTWPYEVSESALATIVAE